MTAGKWRELPKVGLPLEHLTYVTFRGLQWDCYPHFGYSRLNRDNVESWFEIDLVAHCRSFNEHATLALGRV
jgi:hypothetical protein